VTRPTFKVVSKSTGPRSKEPVTTARKLDIALDVYLSAEIKQATRWDGEQFSSRDPCNPYPYPDSISPRADWQDGELVLTRPPALFLEKYVPGVSPEDSLALGSLQGLSNTHAGWTASDLFSGVVSIGVSIVVLSVGSSRKSMKGSFASWSAMASAASAGKWELGGGGGGGGGDLSFVSAASS
jgi:hypothetical protein